MTNVLLYAVAKDLSILSFTTVADSKWNGKWTWKNHRQMFPFQSKTHQCLHCHDDQQVWWSRRWITFDDKHQSSLSSGESWTLATEGKRGKNFFLQSVPLSSFTFFIFSISCTLHSREGRIYHLDDFISWNRSFRGALKCNAFASTCCFFSLRKVSDETNRMNSSTVRTNALIVSAHRVSPMNVDRRTCWSLFSLLISFSLVWLFRRMKEKDRKGVLVRILWRTTEESDAGFSA